MAATNEAINSTAPIIPTLPEFAIDIFPILKFGLIIFLFFYLVLALMVIKQIMMMSQTVKSSGNGFLLFLAYLHLLVVFATLLFSMFIL